MDDAVAIVRGFNRFYTRQIGLLHGGYLDSPFSLSEVRVLYELAHRDKPAAAELAAELGLDAGYLSRILLHFRKLGLILRETSADDRRRTRLSLTREGRRALAPLETRANREIEAMLEKLPTEDSQKLTGAMRTIEDLLNPSAQGVATFVLREHRPGDMGYIVHRHGVLYAREYGYDMTFEALVAEVAAKFVQHFDARSERCWIAEKDGAIVGSVLVVRQTKSVAKLRLLLVEPAARGLGIGRRLVEECIRFAREHEYRKIVLWTQSELLAARRIYENAGFQRVSEKPHHSFGRDLVAETWELKL